MSDFEVTDVQTGQPVVVDEQEATVGLAQGRYSASGPIRALTPEGNLVTIPGERLSEALRAGYRLDTPEAQTGRAERREFQDRPIAAFGARTLGAATYGASDVLARTLGGDEAARVLRGLEEHNPGASIAGEVFGSVAPFFVPSGGGIASRVLRGISAPTRMVAGAAERLGEGAASLVLRGEAGLGRRLAARTLGGITEGALEGAAGEAGRLVTEEAIGYEPDLSGQAVLARLGMGAALGGTLGGSLGLAGGAVREGAGLISRTFASRTGTPLHPLVARVASAASGAPEEALQRVAGADGRVLDDILRRGDRVFDDGIGDLREALDELGAAGRQFQDIERRRSDVLRDMFAGEAGRGAREQEAIEALMQRLRGSDDGFIQQELEHLRQQMQRGVEDAGTVRAPARARPPVPEPAGTAAARRGARVAAEEGGTAAARPGARVAAPPAPGAATGLNEVGQLIEAERAAQGLGPRRVPETPIDPLAQRVARRMSHREIVDGYLAISSLADNLGNVLGGVTDRARRQVLEGIYNDLRSFLTNEPLWGRRVTTFQRNVMERSRAFAVAQQDAARHFFARGADGNFYADPNRIGNFLRRSGKAGNARAEEILQAYVSEMEAYNRSMQRALGQGDGGGSVARAAERARSVAAEAVDKATILNHWREIERAGMQAGGGIGPFVAGGIGHAIGGPLGGMAGVVGAAVQNPARAIRAMSNIRQMIQWVDTRFGESIRTFLNGSGRRVRSSFSYGSVQALRTAYDARIRSLEENSDPEVVTRRIGDSTADIARETPQVQRSIIQTTVAGQMFLRERRPKPAASMGSTLIPEKNSRVAVSEMDRFMRYARAVDTPLSVIDDLEAGRLSREGVEVLQRVYPALYQHLLRQVVEQIAARQEDINYNRKIQLGMLMGIATDYSMTQGFVSTVQSMYTYQEAEQQATAPSRSSRSISSTSLATSTDRLEAEE